MFPGEGRGPAQPKTPLSILNAFQDPASGVIVLDGWVTFSPVMDVILLGRVSAAH
jgi:hypothetical protein